jgi:hypothetical protein
MSATQEVPISLVRARTLAILVALLPAGTAAGGKKPDPAPPLPREHVHPSGAFTFRTPEAWRVEASTTNPDAIEVGGDGLLVRFLYYKGDRGYDSLHVVCMLERLAGEMEQEPQVKYEYDFVGGVAGDRRALDSAFVVTYLQPIAGYTEWRQRNVTLVGPGQSLCAISYAPAPLWKKSSSIRALLDAVLGSVVFR